MHKHNNKNKYTITNTKTNRKQQKNNIQKMKEKCINKKLKKKTLKH